MSDKTIGTDNKAAVVGKKTTPKTHASKTVPKGRIVYNPNLDAWRCIDKNNRTVLSVGSKAAAQRAYPDFIVKE